MVHLVRHSLNFCSWKNRKAVAAKLREVYVAEAARDALEAFDADWGRQYPSIAQAWRRAWQEVIPFFAFSPEIRRVIYTTDVMDKRNLEFSAIFRLRGRPRGEERRIGCERRRAAIDNRLRHALGRIADGDEKSLDDMMRDLVRDVRGELAELDKRIAVYTRRIRTLFQDNEACQRIGKIEGIGPITATALVAAVGDRSCFKNGRQFAAWLG